jgi:hypothetical protein
MQFQVGDRVVVRYDRYGQPIPSNIDTSGKKPWEINGSQGTVTFNYNSGVMCVRFDGHCTEVDVYSLRFSRIANYLTCRGAAEL